MFLKRPRSLVITFIARPVIQQWNWLRRREGKISRNWTPRGGCKNQEGEKRSRDPFGFQVGSPSSYRRLGPFVRFIDTPRMKLLYSKRISIDSRTRDLSRRYISRHKLSVVDRCLTDARLQMNIQESSDRGRWLYWKNDPVAPVDMNPRIYCCFDHFLFFSVCDLFERYTYQTCTHKIVFSTVSFVKTSEILIAKSVPINSSLYTKIMCAII